MSVPPIHVGRVVQIDDEQDEVTSKLNMMKPHVPGIVIFADHNRPLPWSVTYHAVVMFADISGFTALCEKYSGMGQIGVDQLTRTLNEYLGALVEGILGSDGDVIKFAGDAILAIWRVGRVEELQTEILKVVQCCLDIQDKCDEWDTDIGVKLTVKIGVSAGEMTITFLGNQVYRHYVELGPAVTAVNIAEKFCQSGYLVLSPGAWDICLQRRYEVELMGDLSHVRVHAIRPERQRSHSLPMPTLMVPNMSRRGSQQHTSKDDLAADLHTHSLSSKSEKSALPKHSVASPLTVTDSTIAPLRSAEVSTKGKSNAMMGVVSAKMKLGGKFGKLRKLVETVTEMRLDLALRWYILPPVLKKMDDGQPLEYLSEMRIVSVIFMNLIIDETGNAQELLQHVFELVYSQSISMYGCLNKVFLFDKGCTFLVLFGLPGYKHEQDCAHALICSGRMKKRLDKIAGVQLVSIGVTTGTTFCGVVGHPSRHEYSVIGRKVNMAARLMMHYPGKVTCDTTTFQTCRLPPAHFEVLATKRMKGLRNVGVIREFIGHEKEQEMVAKSIKHSDFPLLGRQTEEFMFHEQLALMEKTDKTTNRRKHLIFSGASGLGKTKLLDHVIGIAQGRQFKVISCGVSLEDSSYPYFVANHILRTLLSNIGLSHQIDKEPIILDAIGDDNVSHLYLLNDVIGSTLEKPMSLSSKENVCHSTKRHELLSIIARVCLVSEKETVVVIDDAHYIDVSSWKFMCELSTIDQALIVLGLRPSIIEKPLCRDAANYIDNPNVKLVDITGLDPKFMAPLACQMMCVVVIPKDLDKLLRERSHGVPSWCLEILKDMLDKKQLVVVQDDGSRELRQATIAPNRMLIKPATSDHTSAGEEKHTLRVSVTELVKHGLSCEDVRSETDRALLENLGYTTSAARPTIQMGGNPMEFAGGGAMSSAIGRTITSPKPSLLTPTIQTIDKGKADRIAMFAKGRKASDIPVADSMKELIIARLDSMRSSDQLMVKCAAVLGMTVRRDILEMLLPKAHRQKLVGAIRRLMESGIFQCASTPTSHLAQVSGNRDEGGLFRYKCYCPKDVVSSHSGEPNACFASRFTNNLLQQTAYNVLLEAQRIELHAKAAHYFELSADDVRHYVPYYILERPPPDYLQEALEKSEEDAFTPLKMRRTGAIKRNKVTDETYAKSAAETKARRGRRQAVAITAVDAVALGHRIAEGAKPLETIDHYIEILLPIYDSLCNHWKNCKKPWNVISTLLEATAAAVFLKRNAQALEMIRKTEEMMEEQTLDDSVENQVLRAKVYRLYGKILYQSGDTLQASAYLSKCASILGLHQPKHPEKYRVFTARLRAKLFMFWRLNIRRNKSADLRTLEQGYCLADMYSMDKGMGNIDLKFMHALQQFSRIAGQAVHLHQVITAYSSLIECTRERDWLDLTNKLEDELLRGCAARHQELSTEDRSCVARIYATRSIQFFQAGKLDKANIAGKTAAEICTCIQDLETVKMFAPYYILLCLQKKEHANTVDLLQNLRFSANMTDDRTAKAMYHTFCLEVAMAGGCPPETIQNCMEYITKYLRACDVVANEITKRFYAAMTAALWCARQEQWSRVQVWFDYWEMYEADDDSLFYLLAMASKLECMLHSFSKSSEIGNDAVALQLRKQIKTDLTTCWKKAKRYAVLLPRVGHLQSYFGVLTGNTSRARNAIKSAKRVAKKQGNVYEIQWLTHNQKVWFTKPYKETFNADWKDVTNQQFTDWKLISGLKGDVYRYTLPLPVSTCT